MKNNTNKEKLNDAVGMLDGETVQSALTRAADLKANRLIRRANLRRRAVVLLAACLSLTLMLGAMLAIPLLIPNEPTVTQEDAPPLYIEAPMVKLTNLSATEAATISDPEIPSEQINTQVTQIEGVRRDYCVLSFDCEPGETVTVYSDVACLGLVDQPLNEDTNLSWGGEFYRLLNQVYHKGGLYPVGDNIRFYGTELTVDPSSTSILVGIPYDMDGEIDEVILHFIVKNGEGQITGAGCIYVGRQTELNREEINVTPAWKAEITRSAILGSVRFHDPATVTEEQARELTDTFAARAEEAKGTLSFDPVTPYELRLVTYASIASAVYDGRRISGYGYWNPGGDYSFFSLNIRTGESNEDREKRWFIIFEDRTWAEIPVAENQDCNFYACHCSEACPVTEQRGMHHTMDVGCILTTLDGRVYKLIEQEIDGKMYRSAVRITQETD